MFALVSILGLCLGLALWRAFRDNPTDRTRTLEDRSRSNGSTAQRSAARTRRSDECSDGVGWLDDSSYDIDPRSFNSDDVWEVKINIVILHVDKIVDKPHCIKTMSVALGESIIELETPIGNMVSLNNTGWDGCSTIEASVTVFDEQGQTYRLQKTIEAADENCGSAQKNSKGPGGIGPGGIGPAGGIGSGEEGSNVAGPVLGGLVLCIVVVVLFLGSQERQSEDARERRRSPRKERTTRRSG